MDFRHCPCSGKTLGKLVQPAVLAALAREPLHGYLLLQRLSAMPMFQASPPDPTGVYRLLKAMERDGHLKSSWDLAGAGPAKRRFQITSAGRACLAEWTRTLEHYHQTVADLLTTIRHSTRPTPRPPTPCRTCAPHRKGACCG